jgi:hypothetical protein
VFGFGIGAAEEESQVEDKFCTATGVDLGCREYKFLGQGYNRTCRCNPSFTTKNGNSSKGPKRIGIGRMFSSNGIQFAARRVSSESVVAQEFFGILWTLSGGECCRGLKTSTF